MRKLDIEDPQIICEENIQYPALETVAAALVWRQENLYDRNNGSTYMTEAHVLDYEPLTGAAIALPGNCYMTLQHPKPDERQALFSLVTKMTWDARIGQFSEANIFQKNRMAYSKALGAEIYDRAFNALKTNKELKDKLERTAVKYHHMIAANGELEKANHQLVQVGHETIALYEQQLEDFSQRCNDHPLRIALAVIAAVVWTLILVHCHG
jgi:hypothetical protein